MSRYRLRVELPDLPGALAKVATVISDLDGDVVSIDIHELDGHQAVDELVVEVLTELDGRVLGAALEEAERRHPAVVRAGRGPGRAGGRGARVGAGAGRRPTTPATVGRILAVGVPLVEGVGGADRRGPRGAGGAPRARAGRTARAAVARPARAARRAAGVDDVAARGPRRSAARALHRVPRPPGSLRFTASEVGAGRRADGAAPHAHRRHRPPRAPGRAALRGVSRRRRVASQQLVPVGRLALARLTAGGEEPLHAARCAARRR